jgi:hypothetical protein
VLSATLPNRKTKGKTVLHSFHVTDGQQPEGSLLEYKSRFYGTTVGGGGDLSGEVYELQPQRKVPQHQLLWIFRLRNGVRDYAVN